MFLFKLKEYQIKSLQLLLTKRFTYLHHTFHDTGSIGKIYLITSMNHHYRGVFSGSKLGRITNTSVSAYLNTLLTCINVPLSETGERPR